MSGPFFATFFQADWLGHFVSKTFCQDRLTGTWSPLRVVLDGNGWFWVLISNYKWLRVVMDSSYGW